MKKFFLLLLLPLLISCGSTNPTSSSELKYDDYLIEIEETDSFSKEEKTFYREDNKKICGLCSRLSISRTSR